MKRVDFDTVARSYEARHDNHLRFLGESSEAFVRHKVGVVSRFWRETALADDGRFLDLGCGTGRIWKFLSRALPRVRYTGIDVSAESIEVAREQPGDIDFRVQEGKQLGFEDGSFDLVFAACVLHHVPLEDRAALYQEIRRVLRPGGFFFVFEHNPWNPVTQYLVRTCDFDDDALLLSAPELCASLRRAGFRRPRRSYAIFLPSALRERWPGVEPLLASWAAGAQYWLAARR